jgi:hypothetical protein
MALTEAVIDAHIARWEQTLANSAYPYRSKWPARLFHHAPLENIAAILNSGSLLSRDDSNATRPLDVAEPSIINNRTAAHAFGRLYFRPRTPTQFCIEGIRKPTEYYKGTKHCPTIGVLVFDTKTILMMDGVKFTPANMQSHGTRSDSSEEFFQTIDFASVYHEGPFAAAEKAAIIARRCAEVLVPSPLPLNAGALRWVYCRSNAERMYLLDMLNYEEKFWAARVRVSDDLRVFEKRHTFVQSVDISDEGIIFSLAPRIDAADVKIAMSVRNATTNISVVTLAPQMIKPIPPNENKNWIIKHPMTEGRYRVEIWLEDCRAFSAELLHESIPF